MTPSGLPINDVTSATYFAVSINGLGDPSRHLKAINNVAAVGHATHVQPVKEMTDTQIVRCSMDPDEEEELYTSHLGNRYSGDCTARLALQVAIRNQLSASDCLSSGHCELKSVVTQRMRDVVITSYALYEIAHCIYGRAQARLSLAHAASKTYLDEYNSQKRDNLGKQPSEHEAQELIRKQECYAAASAVYKHESQVTSEALSAANNFWKAIYTVHKVV